MVEDLTGRIFKSIRSKETYNIDTYKINDLEDKILRTEVDIEAKTENGDIVTIEMQVTNHDHYLERTLFYAAHAYISSYGNEENINKTDGDPNAYAAIRNTYGISIVDFNLFDQSLPALVHFAMAEKTLSLKLQELLRMHSIELIYLSLVNKNIDEKSNAFYWQQFFKTGKALEGAPESVKAAHNIVSSQNLTRKEKEMVEMIDRQRANSAAVLSTAKRIGREEGIEIGQEKEARKIAKNMMLAGLSIEDISKITQYSSDVVKMWLVKEAE